MARVRYFDEKETFSPEERQRYFNEKVREIITYAYNNSSTIRERFDRLGLKPEDIKTTKDLEKLPIMTKDEVVELQRQKPPFGGLLTIPVENMKRICVSPGPLYEPGWYGEERAGMIRGFVAAGFGRGEIVLNTFSYHLVPAGLGVDDAVIRLGGVVIPGGIGYTDLQVQIMKDLGVTAFVGTPSFLYTLIQRAEQQGYDFRRDFKLRRAFLGAEMYPPSLRKIFEEQYGLDTYEFYGTAELGLLAYQCPQKQGMHLTEDAFIEIVDSEGKQLGSGEIGQVVVTSFEKIYCLIRFGTGDLSLYTDEPCPCGRTSPRLLRIAGRVGDAIKVRGMFLHPKEVEDVFADFPQVANFQAVITRERQRDFLTVKVELKEELDREKFAERLQQAIQNKCRLRADRIEFVAPGTIPKERKALVDERVWE